MRIWCAYLAIALMYLCFSVATYKCDGPFETESHGTCMANAFASSYYKAVLWPIAIIFEVTH